MKNFKKRWDIKSNFQLVVIFLVFSINGSLSLYLARPILEYFGVTLEVLHPMLYWPLRLLIVFFIYQVLLVAVGTLFGQYKFFWKFEKMMLSRLGLLRL